MLDLSDIEHRIRRAHETINEIQKDVIQEDAKGLDIMRGERCDVLFSVEGSFYAGHRAVLGVRGRLGDDVLQAFSGLGVSPSPIPTSKPPQRKDPSSRHTAGTAAGHMRYRAMG